ncbi:BadF-type ATPase [Paraburkholderia phenazinium]|uniref:BadF-type ATPase n=1 Tax=Paraburkholderia phenazinium TaxID=60549 RepID=A0A1G7VCV4_9BURK|nr:BadF/BadG/BcrA/BcrD ATPase family protein [Paraburkholderia phenazinium]SDG57391.1 BadF-type ATPase [Paraburkholderia phenazinium]
MTHAPEFVLGIDAGGTKTLLAIAERSGAVQFVTHGPTLDPTSSPVWAREMVRLVESAAVYMPHVRSAAVGLPFFGEVETISQAQREICAGLFSMNHEVVNDVQVAFDGAFAGRGGVLLLAGTGSMAWAGDGRGSDIRVGGWGDAFGDEGSAYWIGREALSEAARALDGRGSDVDFAHLLLQGLRIGEADLIAWSYAEATRRSKIASVAKLVSDIAAVNETARSILERAGDLLYEHAKAGFERSGLPESADWSYAGGVFSSGVVLDRLVSRIGRVATSPQLPPVGGALLRAARLSKWVTDASWVASLAGSLA